jgi:hypothetical protein
LLLLLLWSAAQAALLQALRVKLKVQFDAAEVCMCCYALAFLNWRVLFSGVHTCAWLNSQNAQGLP